MTAVVLSHHDETCNMHRYYVLDIQRDLFGAECLILEWGRIGQSGGTWRSIPYLPLRKRGRRCNSSNASNSARDVLEA